MSEPTTAVAVVPDLTSPSAEALQQLMLMGDLSMLTMAQKAQYTWHLAVSKGLDPTTQPFNIIALNGKMVVYANRACADQIRKRDGITSTLVYRGPLRMGISTDGMPKYNESVWEVEYVLTDSSGRTENTVGCVGIKGLDGEALANATLKCDTKSKRRGTLAMGGLGFLDELEVESVQKQAEANIGVGQPRRIVPPAARVTVEPPIEASYVEQGDPLPVSAVSPSTPTAPPPPPPTFRKPLPVARPPVKV